MSDKKTPCDITGAIISHGFLIKDQLVVIPEGIYLRPLSNLGVDLSDKVGIGPETRKLLISAKNRKETWDSGTLEDFHKRSRSHFYNPGDIIHDMYLYFKSTWEYNIEGNEIDPSEIDPSEIENLPDGVPQKNISYVSYYSTGIITDGIIMGDTKTISLYDKTKEQKIEEVANIFKESMACHDENIIKKEDIWNQIFTLGNILKMITNNRKQGCYYLLACRGCKDYINPYCPPQYPPEMERPKFKRQTSTEPELKNIKHKLEIISKYNERVKIALNSGFSALFNEAYVTIRNIIDKINYTNTIYINELCFILNYYSLYIKSLQNIEESKEENTDDKNNIYITLLTAMKTRTFDTVSKEANSLLKNIINLRKEHDSDVYYNSIITYFENNKKVIFELIQIYNEAKKEKYAFMVPKTEKNKYCDIYADMLTKSLLIYMVNKMMVLFESTRLDSAGLDPAMLHPARLDSARLDSARLDSARLDSARLDPARLESARLESARVESTRLEFEKLKKGVLLFAPSTVRKFISTKININNILMEIEKISKRIERNTITSSVQKGGRFYDIYIKNKIKYNNLTKYSFLRN